MPEALVIIADGSEELEAVTIIDILRRGDVEVTVASLDGEPITASRGVRIVPDTSLRSVAAKNFDVVVLPGGGPGTENLAADPGVIDLVQRQNEAEKWVAAICAAPLVLEKAGVLESRKATSYPGALSPGSTTYSFVEDHVVVDGHVVTSRGPGTALDFSLILVEKLCGQEKRDAVEKGLAR